MSDEQQTDMSITEALLSHEGGHAFIKDNCQLVVCKQETKPPYRYEEIWRGDLFDALRALALKTTGDA